MKPYINLPLEQQKKLSSCQKMISQVLVSLQRDNNYDADIGLNYFYISVFDHWLSLEEANVLLDKTHHANYAKLIYDFHSSLFENFNVLAFKKTGRYSKKIYTKPKPEIIRLRKFTSKNSFLSCTRSILNEPHTQDFIFPTLLLPEQNLIYKWGFDFTNAVYFNKESTLDEIKELAVLSKLFILEK